MGKIFDQTPEGKKTVFEIPELLLTTNKKIVYVWQNTQPLYFYPFSWLDYLNFPGIRELQIIDGKKPEKIQEAIRSIEKGKIHFETINIELIEEALCQGHKVSVICDLAQIEPIHANTLSQIDILRVRIGDQEGMKINILEKIANRHLLTCAKVYLTPENKDYLSLANDLQGLGVDLLHISKYLEQERASNPLISRSERDKIISLRDLETPQFKVKLPASLERIFADKFEIAPEYHNVRNCIFSSKRRTYANGSFYPCYTKHIVAYEKGTDQIDSMSVEQMICSDCACIYENDMLSDIIDKSKKFKNPKFSLRYIQNGR